MTAATLNAWIRRIVGILRRLGPYAAIEIILPGGSLVVLLLLLFRRREDVHALSRAVRTWLVTAIEDFASSARA